MDSRCNQNLYTPLVLKSYNFNTLLAYLKRSTTKIGIAKTAGQSFLAGAQDKRWQ